MEVKDEDEEKKYQPMLFFTFEFFFTRANIL
jgi:hypothetical protein